ncbi:sensor histidine kinase [Cognatishimia sp.]|uniref:sensor histidine kinase n=1 Tax=Cognatishimia sp. TaxID=2211648 RepID=UPI0035194317
MFRKLWFRLALWFVALLCAFFVLFTLAYIVVDIAFLATLSEAEREAFFAADDLSAALDPISENVTILLGLGVAIPLSVFASTILAMRITKPISDVGQAAQAVASGNLSARAPVPRSQEGGEIGALIENVNSLLDMVQASDQQIKEDAAAIAHELRTPLAALQMKLHGMIDGVVDVSTDELQRLLAQSQVLARVVEDLRTLSLASRGDLTLVPAKTDLMALVRSVVGIHAKPLDTAQITVVLAGEAVVADVDPDRMRQALSNLIENAIRYAAEGETLDISVSADQDTARLVVADRGPGLDVDFRAVVFEPFQRAEASRSRELGGSGLGLSIVKAIAEAHGGSVGARPRDGGGLEIHIDLPLTNA